MKHLTICGQPQYNVITWVDGVKLHQQIGCNNVASLRAELSKTADRVRFDPVMVGEGWGE